MTRLSATQFACLDHLAENHPEVKVVSWEVNKEGQFCPVIEYRGGFRVLAPDGHLVGSKVGA